MKPATKSKAFIVLACILLAGIVVWYIYPYGFRVSALFHLGKEVADQQSLPSGFVVLGVPSYDGAEYFRIAQRIPAFLSPDRWNELKGVSPGAYAYQRFLYPFLAFILAFGNIAWLPWTFLLISVFSLLMCGYLAYRMTGKGLQTCAMAFSPAALIGLHFSTAEPLNIALLTILLLRLKKREGIDFWNGLLLCLLVITREINFPLVVMVFIWFSLRRDRPSVFWTLPAIAVFILWQALLSKIFGSIPFLVNSDNATWPLIAPLSILFGTKGYSIYTLSSVALFALFVAPAAVLALKNAWREKAKISLTLTLLCGYLAIMLIMPLHIWGSITSIGRAITPVYPLAAYEAGKMGRAGKLLLLAILVLGLGAVFGLGSIVHPYAIR